ncbi:ECF transporter S component [Geobacillus sp. 46C-IIa]|uniref:ECF transporter S component n=1 Tax=Geobacillus sp. 46C-IIa TaxID=1963025 RepID=UPI0009C0DC95|nr:ECF transporter S component [Geobacillus sp. 46C-IIa]OQP05971.1 ECF transporter S component [Geobacillus sp. 46C-IIa]QNU29014.1 ECF transporter S component [Geobacillus sp. 46C-IIa]
MNRRFAWLAVCLALSVIGSFIKLPTFVGSIALDSAPALVAAAVLGPRAGATVAGLGHFISAYVGGWPLGPFHWLVACEMAGLSALFAAMYGRGWRFGGAAAFFVGNVFLAPLPLVVSFGWPFVAAIIPPLSAAAAANVLIAMAVMPSVVRLATKAGVRAPHA